MEESNGKVARLLWQLLGTVASAAILGTAVFIFNLADRIVKLEEYSKNVELRRADVIQQVMNALATGEKARDELVKQFNVMDNTDDEQTREIVRLKDRVDRLEHAN